jgi:hypothetical protein
VFTVYVAVRVFAVVEMVCILHIIFCFEMKNERRNLVPIVSCMGDGKRYPNKTTTTKSELFHKYFV